MSRSAMLLLCLMAMTGARAEPGAVAPEQSGLLCRQAIAAAARSHGVPPSLMAAVGRVESGRRDPVSGAWHPWPWTVDAEGQGTFYDTKAQAVAAVRALQARGMRSIDVGCMQVNLLHHPTAFASLEQAFDPGANADYAARFLVELHGPATSWPHAAALYHSQTPDLAAAYEQKVLAAWPGEERLAGIDPPTVAGRAWGSVAAAIPLHYAASVQRNPGMRSAQQSAPGNAGTLPAGRGLAAYRAAPIQPGWRRLGG